MTKKDKLFLEAIDVLNEMLKYGDHKGKCTNVGNPFDSCTKHLSAAKRRENRAVKFMVRNGYIPGSKP